MHRTSGCAADGRLGEPAKGSFRQFVQCQLVQCIEGCAAEFADQHLGGLERSGLFNDPPDLGDVIVAQVRASKLGINKR